MPVSAIFPTAPMRAGMYESFCLRAVSPDEPVDVWIRNTVHKRPGRPPQGSVWCTLFDARRGRPFMHKETTDELTVPAGGWIAVGDYAVMLAGKKGELKGGQETPPSPEAFVMISKLTDVGRDVPREVRGQDVRDRALQRTQRGGQEQGAGGAAGRARSQGRLEASGWRTCAWRALRRTGVKPALPWRRKAGAALGMSSGLIEDAPCKADAP